MRRLNAWTSIALSGLVTSLYGVSISSFAVYVVPMNAQFGWSIPTITGALTSGLLVSAALAVPVGRLMDRVNPATVMAAAALAGATFLLGAAHIESLVGLYVIWSGFGVIFAAGLYEAAFAVIRRRCGSDSSRCMAIVAVGGGMSSILYPPLAAQLIESGGLESAITKLSLLHFTTAGVCLVTAIRAGAFSTWSAAPVAPRSVGIAPSLLPLSLAFAAAAFVASAVAVHLVPHLVREGFSLSMAAHLFAAGGAVGIGGRVWFVHAAGRQSVDLRLLRIVCFTQAAGLSVLAVGTTKLTYAVFLLLFAAVVGIVTPLAASITAALVPAEVYATANGRVALGGALGRAAGPFLGAVIADRLGAGNALFATCGILMAASGVLVGFQKTGSSISALVPGEYDASVSP